VDVTLEPIAGPAPAPAAAAAGGAPPREQPQRVVVRLEEAPLYRLRYGFQVTSDLAPATDANDVRLGVSAELRRRNLFGTGLTAGVGGRYEVGNYSARAALSVPSSVLWPSLSTLYFKQSLSTDETETGAVKTYETSVTYQERWRLGQKSELSYGYAFIREDLQNAAVVGLAEGDSGPTHRANLFAALAWDRRDSAFDATKGWFHSSSLEYGAPAIASDFSYLRYLFQQTGYRRIGPLVLAGAARVGVLVHVTGDDNETYSLRFRTGGDRTVRGYAQDSLSALGESGAMVGGRGLLVVNGEVRFPVWGWLKAATFLDAGNAFATPADISFAGLEVGAGFGIRLDTPYALFRLDLGFPLPQHTRPIVSRWYFSIGQAF
jgi:outer membrane translocation and assembly module TamA